MGALPRVSHSPRKGQSQTQTIPAQYRRIKAQGSVLQGVAEQGTSARDQHGLVGPWGELTDSSYSQGVVPRPPAAAVPGNLLKMQIPGSCPKPTESETGDGAQQTYLNKPSNGF